MAMASLILPSLPTCTTFRPCIPSSCGSALLRLHFSPVKTLTCPASVCRKRCSSSHPSSVTRHYTTPRNTVCSSLQLGDTAHDLFCTVALFAGSYAWIRTFDILVEKKVLEQKESRKIIHISTGLLYVLAWPIFSTSPWSRCFAVAIPLANAIKLLVNGLGVWKDEGFVKSISRSGTLGELLRGPFYYVFVLACCTIFFWRESPVGMTALAIMCGGDGIADIVGRRFGGLKLPYNSRKSWAGSISMFAFGFALSLSFLYYYSSLGFYCVDWTTGVPSVALISAIATVVESLPISTHVDDNISVPLASVLVGLALFPAAT